MRSHPKIEEFVPLADLAFDNIEFSIQERAGKPCINMYIGAGVTVAFFTPPCVTHWPRCTGDGNYGTLWGPSDVAKAKFQLDLTDAEINDAPNTEFNVLMNTMEGIDDKLLEFVFQNQMKLLGRKNLSKEEVKMLQIRSVRKKYDRSTGYLNGHTIQLSTPKFTWDGMGGKYENKVNVFDYKGTLIEGGDVSPGDVVSAMAYAAQVYTGVGGDKFGIQWSFPNVSIKCQRAKLQQTTQISGFNVDYPYCQEYQPVTNSEVMVTE